MADDTKGEFEKLDIPQMGQSLLGLLRELVEEFNARRLIGRSIHLDCSMERDLGIDSLARVELLGRIENKLNKDAYI